MALRKILTEPNTILRQKSLLVDKVDEDVRKLMDDMLETMYAAPGIGLAAIGEEETFDTIKTVEVVLKTALDQGITFFDTAECYFYSEEMVGHSISDRRSDFLLATKCGHPTPGQYDIDWSIEGILLTLDRSLKRLKTDYVDLLQLHSCSVEVLEQGEVIAALTKARDAGKTRFIGYSGDNEAAQWAVDSGHFDTLQTSFNLADQRPRNGLLQRAKQNGLGVIAKRPIANTAWGLSLIHI